MMNCTNRPKIPKHLQCLKTATTTSTKTHPNVVSDLGQACFLCRALLFLKIRQELKKKYAHDHEIAALKNLLPGEADPNAAGVAQSQAGLIFQLSRGFPVGRFGVSFHGFFLGTFLLKGQDAEGGEEQ